MPRFSPPAVALALASLVAVPATAVAQDATPVASPVTADPAQCRVEPRPAAFFEDAVRRAVASPPPPPTFPPGETTVNPTPIAVSEEGSRPADAETVAAVGATAGEYFACINAGDFSRLLALYTEQAARDNVAFLLSRGISQALDEGTPAAALEAQLVEAFGGFATAAATPLPAERRVPRVDVANVRVLSDGRVAADVVVAGAQGVGGSGRLLFAEEGGRFLLVGPLASPEDGTPTAATPVP